jgi:hypothetical protein
MIPNAQVFWSRNRACWFAIERIASIRPALRSPERMVAYGYATLALLKAANRWHQAYLCALRLGRND